MENLSACTPRELLMLLRQALNPVEALQEKDAVAQILEEMERRIAIEEAKPRRFYI